MKIRITKWKSMSWQWLHRDELEGREIEVIREVEGALHKGHMAYLIEEPNRYISVKDCEIVEE